MAERYRNIEKALHCELEKLDKKYGSETAEMSIQDAQRVDMLYHALKSAETYHAMEDAKEWDEEGDTSGGMRDGRSNARRSYATRRRDSMGRYTSRDMYPEETSGHYPEWMPPYYPQRY